MKGGKREGAGRHKASPELKKAPITIKLPPWLIDWMRKQDESQAVLVEKALCEKHKLSPSK